LSQQHDKLDSQNTKVLSEVSEQLFMLSRQPEKFSQNETIQMIKNRNAEE